MSGIADCSESNHQESKPGIPAIILALAGSIIGIGGFLRFPGVALQNGGSAFIIPYLLAFLFLGIPICWMEWILGRRAGRLSGLSSAPGLLNVITNEGKLRYLGVLAIFIPAVIFMYYIYAVSWCLAYSWFYISGMAILPREEAYQNFFEQFIGNGSGEYFSSGNLRLTFFLITFTTAFLLVFRGITHKIKRICQISMLFLFLTSLILAVRVLTLSILRPELPAPEILSSLGYLWNPEWNQLTNPTVWITAIGQTFFTLSVSMGVIHTYSSYLTKNDDLVLCSLASCTIKEFAEICLGGLIFIPAAFIFFGITTMESMAKTGTFSISFVGLPPLFDTMPLGWILAACFYFSFFMAGIFTSVTLLQPIVTFFEEGLGMRRNRAVLLLCFLTLAGAGAIFYSPGLPVMDTADYYTCNVLIPIFAFMEILLFIFVFKVDTGIKEAGYGAAMRLPRSFGFMTRFITPLFLMVILSWGLFEQFKLWLNPACYAGNLFVLWQPEMHKSLVLWLKPDWSTWHPYTVLEIQTLLTLTAIFIFIAVLHYFSWPRMSRQYHAYLHALPPEESE